MLRAKKLSHRTCSSHAAIGKLPETRFKFRKLMMTDQMNSNLQSKSQLKTSVILTKNLVLHWNNAKERPSSPWKKDLIFQRIQTNLISIQLWRKFTSQIKPRELSHPKATSLSIKEAILRESKSWRKSS